ncbi:MAG: ABC transporter substrate-binding protein [Caulobacteraceae bacterium]
MTETIVRDRPGFPRRGVLGLGLAVLLPAAARAAPGAGAAITDARGRRLGAPDLSRVVCIGGAITEIVYALGVSDHVIAVDSTSQFPPAALHEKRNVGYMRGLSPEGVLALNPSLILVMQDAGPPQAIDVLAASPVPVAFVDATPSPQAVLGRVRFVASVFGVPARGEDLSKTIQNEFAALTAWRSAHTGHRRVLFVLSMQNDRPMVAGAGTAADAIIALAGGINAAGALQGYKPVSDEALSALAPDVVLAMDHAGPSFDAGALGRGGFRLTPAGRTGALIRMDGEFLLGFGPRTPEAALGLAKRLSALPAA